MDSSRFHCVDLGGTRIEHVLAGDNLSIQKKLTFETKNFPRPEDWIREITARFPSINDTPWMIGVPSPVEHQRRITETPNLPPDWSGDSLTEVLEQHDIDYRLENDANLAAYGVFTKGKEEGGDNLVLLTLGTGLGCGIVINGDLYRGSTGGSGELGHVVIVPDGRPCGCGNQGCLERYASATGLEITYSETTGVERSAEEIMARVPGEEAARKAADTTARYLGRAIALAVNILEPDRVVLGGGLSGSFDKIRSPVRNHYRDHVFASRLESLPITTSSLENPALQGGLAWLVHQENQKPDN